MGKKRLTGLEKEIHKQAVSIRKRIAAMPDTELVEISKRIEPNNLAKRNGKRAAEQPLERTINKVAEFLDELEGGAVSGIGTGKIQKMREFAQDRKYI